MTLPQSSDMTLTGIGVIDDQHQVILDCVCELADSAADTPREVLSVKINRILMHTLAHFEFEEELMKQVGYEYLKAHKRLHDHFIQRLAALIQRFDHGETVTGELVQFLNTWLRSHFAHEDRDYSPQILSEMQGLSSQANMAKRESWISRALRKIA